ncbi:MAG: DUF2478 domain-containing protein [Hyphomicrobium sp.]|jgi:hypothetical protein
MKLAAVIYQPGAGHAVDTLLCDAAVKLEAAGIKVAGAVQRNTVGDGSCCQMLLEDIASKTAVDISLEPPGRDSCRLNPAALEDAAGLVAASLGPDVNLMIVNRFGKQEISGQGFRGAIETAVAEGIPVIVALNAAHLERWRAFTENEAVELVPTLAAIMQWCASNVSRLSAGKDGTRSSGRIAAAPLQAYDVSRRPPLRPTT